MEAEKEKSSPETTENREDTQPPRPDDQPSENHVEDPSDNIDYGQAPPPVSSPTKSQEETSKDLEKSETKQEECSPMPPDIIRVSEEMDNFITCLSLAKDTTEAPPDIPICVEQFAVLVEARIEDYESSDPPVRWSQLSFEESNLFLESVCRISKVSNWLCKFQSESKYAYSMNRVGGVLQRAISYLEDEFKLLVEDCNTSSVFHPRDLSSSDFNTTLPNKDNKDQSTSAITYQEESESDPTTLGNITFPGYSEDIMLNLERLARVLIQEGYDTECCQAYFVARRNALAESLHKLGFQKHSIDDVQKMQWEALTREIELWITSLKQSASILFPNERKLADAVFVDYKTISVTLFNTLSTGVLMELLNLSEAVAMTKRAPEKLFKFLDMYESLRDIAPCFDDLFDLNCAEEMKSEASQIRSRLGEAMIIIFSELENSIKSDSGKTSVPGGAVHPLTRYIMNYLPYACEYRETLEQVFREHQKIERADSRAGSDFDYNSQGGGQGDQNSEAPREQQVSPFQIQLIKVMDLLDTNLEAKSKLYKDASLSSIFMMNNGRYILQKIRGSSEINSLMGDSWCRKRSSDLRQYHKNYQRETWGKPLNCLMNHEGLNVNGKVVKPVLKERFKSFNAMFDEIHRTQSTWVVCDEQLQSELRVSVSNMVIPAYRAFLARYAQTLTPGRQTEKYVKLQPEDIETYIDELFDGNATPTGRKKL